MPLTAATIGAPIVGGVVGNIMSSGDKTKAREARDAAVQQFIQLSVPSIAEQQVALEHYKQTGQLTPELEQTFQQQQSAMNGISLDPTYKQAQINALTKLQDLSNQGGLDAQSQQQIAQVTNQQNANEKGQRDAITQNFAQRGVGGSGAELAAMLSASQGDANKAASQGLDIQAQAKQRALQALTQSSQIGSNLSNQDFQQQSAVAQANDAINRFNTQNSQNVANTNTQTLNDAQKYNLNTQQDIANKNVGVDNQEELHNKGLYQSQFQDNVSKAQGASGALNSQANGYQNSAQQTANQWANIGSAVGAGAAAFGQKKSSTSSDDSEEE